MLRQSGPEWKGKQPAELVDKMHDAARRVMAASCMAFLEGQDTGTERWHPYWDWVRLVKPQDCILTFNYDLVIERLLEDGPKQKPPVKTGHIEILAPSADPEPDCASVLKLHGSVNWRRNPAGWKVDQDPRLALTCGDKELGILSPGSHKLLESRGGLAKLWARAVEALKQADAIVLLGYRFPPSDSYARKTLLRAIAETTNTTADVLVARIVLGPNSKDADRTAQMVRYAYGRTGRRPEGPSPPHTKHYKVGIQHMYTQDFMSIVERKQLFD